MQGGTFRRGFQRSSLMEPAPAQPLGGPAPSIQLPQPSCPVLPISSLCHHEPLVWGTVSVSPSLCLTTCLSWDMRFCG